MNYYASRDRNIKAAQAHHKEMLKKYPEEIKRSINRTIVYGGGMKEPWGMRRASRYHGKTELDAAGFIRAEENDKHVQA